MLVKAPIKVIMPVIVTCWGASLCGMSGSENFTALAATRFLLGWCKFADSDAPAFWPPAVSSEGNTDSLKSSVEAMALPLFSLITVTFYRRAEQPLRVAAWCQSASRSLTVSIRVDLFPTNADASNGYGTMLGSALVYGTFPDARTFEMP